MKNNKFCITSSIPLKEKKIDIQALEQQDFTQLGFEHELNDDLTENEQVIPNKCKLNNSHKK
ncbi:hypothetical protein [uncultured Legionella sp.]|uniref:hypothetical protein n=1 Tax=uncultured Legionella sp. TaxID=210934 RepID=UPI0026022CE4|nr:hypothetical protein [uncultured Legionella sp.]